MFLAGLKRLIAPALLLCCATQLEQAQVAVIAAQSPADYFHAFKGRDGASPWSGVVRDSAGNVYGTTYVGGQAGEFGVGTVYKVDRSGQETVLFNFNGAQGAYPIAGVILDSTGNLYGTTTDGGAFGYGVVYKLDPSGRQTVLHSFSGGAGSLRPTTGVIRDSAGNLYGTTDSVVYKLNASGQETVLYTFTGGLDGEEPMGGVIRDSAGNLYGTTNFGGAFGYGVVYKLDKAGLESVLYAFTGGVDGGHPMAGVVLDSTGNLYGTTYNGGAFGYGVVYKLDEKGQETVLYSFTGGPDGAWPMGGVIRDTAGNLYGTTSFGGDTHCGYPSGCGLVYKLDTEGQQTVVYAFTGQSDGAVPFAGVIRDSQGNLYGTTYTGTGPGSVFKVSVQ